MFYSSLNLTSIKNIFGQLEKLEVVDNQCKQVIYFSSNGLSVQQSTESTLKKISNYIGEWKGWSSNFDQFPILTAKVKAFIKEHQQEALELDKNSVETSIIQVGLLLNAYSKESKAAINIQQAVEDLLWIESELNKIRSQNNQTLASKEQTVFYEPLANSNSHTQEAVYHPQALAILNKAIYYHEEKDSEYLKQTIRGLFFDRELNDKAFYSVGPNESIRVPRQFFVDCTRVKRLTLNGEVLFGLKNQLNYSAITMSRYLIEKLGQENFELLGALIHQSFMADIVIDLKSKKISLEEQMCEASPIYNMSIRQAEGYEFDIRINEQEVQINALLSLDVFVPGENGPSSLGYFTVVRTVSFPRKEVEAISDKQPEDILPSLKVNQQFSDICRTVQEARNNLNSSLIYRYFYKHLV